MQRPRLIIEMTNDFICPQVDKNDMGIRHT